MREHLTKQQVQAIENRGGSLLVSAAAGSGKTFVLVNRLLDYVEKENLNLDDFLVITFTKSAAAELKSKIAKEINERVAGNTTNQKLREQLFRVYSANIKTIDAYCLNLLRENLQLIQFPGEDVLTPDFHVLGEAEAMLIKDQILEETLDQFYENLSDEEQFLVNTIGFGRSDFNLKNTVLQIYDKTETQPFPKKWLQENAENWDNIGESLNDNAFGCYLMEDMVRRTNFWMQKVSETIPLTASDEKLAKSYGLVLEELKANMEAFVKASEKGWDAMAACDFTVSSVRCGASDMKDYVKKVADLCKDDLKEMQKLLSVSEKDYLDDLRHMAPAMKALCKLTSAFIDAYQAEKVRRNCMDFSDQEHYAIQILLNEDGSKTQFAQQVSLRFREVMVDEYQDINKVQDYLFKAISQEEKNLFTVGDVKQSIYGFRLADPTFFIEKYDAFKGVEEAEKGESRKVLLNYNFRSRQSILKATNFVFSNILSKEMGDVDYTKDEYLDYGSKDYESEDSPVEFHFVSLEKDENGHHPNRELTEANYIAHRIQELVSSGFMVNGEDKKPRPCTYDDIVILMRSPKNRVKLFARVLNQWGITCGIEEDSEFFQCVEVAILVSFLKILDNPHQDIPLISVLRSPLFGFSADCLAEIRAKHHGGDFFDALIADEEEDSKRFIQLLEELRQFAKDYSVEVLLWHLYDVCHVLPIFEAMENGRQRRANLVALYTYAKEQAGAGIRNLFDFITQLDRLIQNDKAPSLSTKESGMGVRIMTIHKSKGLEFPIVIMADLHKDINKKDTMPDVLVHPYMGLGTKNFDLDRSICFDTVSRLAIKKRLQRETKAEELRLIYVAMTRAKEKLIMVDCPKDYKSKLEELFVLSNRPCASEAVTSLDSFDEWIMLPLITTIGGKEIAQFTGYPLDMLRNEDSGIQVTVTTNPSYQPNQDDFVVVSSQENAVINIPLLEATYGHEKATLVPKKRIATQFKGRMEDKDQLEEETKVIPSYFDRPKFLQKTNDLSAAEKGSAMHSAMQYIRFNCKTEEDIQREVEKLVDRRIISKEEGESVDVKKIATFLNSSLADRIRGAEKLYQEYRFSVLENASIIDPDLQDEEILVQGVVDLMFVDQSGLHIVDFKTDKITTEEEKKRSEYYRGQIDAYATCMEKVFNTKVCEKVLYFFATDHSVTL